jgi:hypothetical protein
METILRRTWLAEDAQGPSASSLQRVVRRVVLNTMLDRAGDARTTADVRQVVALHLEKLADQLESLEPSGNVANDALRAAAIREIEAFLDGEDVPANRTRYPVIALPWP